MSAGYPDPLGGGSREGLVVASATYGRDLPTERATYRVRPGTQVNLDGVVHGEGATLDVDPALAGQWLTAGYIEPVRTRKRATTAAAKGEGGVRILPATAGVRPASPRAYSPTPQPKDGGRLGIAAGQVAG